LQGDKGWPVSVICDTVDIENVTDALKTGPYGRCVYDMDNDVMSHQVKHRIKEFTTCIVLLYPCKQSMGAGI